MQQTEVLPSRSDTKHRRLDRAAAVLFRRAGLLLVLVLLCASGSMRLRVCASSSSFDIKEHLSTKVRVCNLSVHGICAVINTRPTHGKQQFMVESMQKHAAS